MEYLHYILKGLSHKATLEIAKRYGEGFPMYLVVGFPRSGTTWLSEMLSSYYNLPRPSHYYLPLAFGSIIHTHASPSCKFRKVYYIVRDGRDVYVSWYFQVQQMLKNKGFQWMIKKKHGNELQLAETVEEHKTNLRRFIVRHAREKMNWQEHTRRWCNFIKNRRNVPMLRYEDLRIDGTRVLYEAIKVVDGKCDRKVLTDIMNQHAFDRMSRRDTSQHGTFLRKGAVGDWKNYFTRESALAFEDTMGEALYQLGYESDKSWIEKIKN